MTVLSDRVDVLEATNTTLVNILNSLKTTLQGAVDSGQGIQGWSPILGVVSDGDRRVLQIDDWTGGDGGTKPSVGSYIGSTGEVATVAEALDIRGPGGTTAYEVWVDDGNVGTVADFFDDLSAGAITATNDNVTAAALSETNAATSATNSAADVVLTNADVVSTNADAATTAQDAIDTAANVTSTNADRVVTTQDAIDTAADVVTTNADAATTAQDAIDTAADAAATAQDVIDTAANLAATNQDTIDTASDLAATNQDAIDTAAALAATVQDVIDAAASETAAASSASAASTSESNAATSETNAAASFNSFNDRYLGKKASDPTVDNDGGTLVEGTLYFNETDKVMLVYEGSSWVAAYASLSGAALSANNGSDFPNKATVRTNLGVAIGSNVQAYDAVLDGTTASYITTEKTKLSHITVSQAVDLDQMETDIAALANGMVYKGDWDASSGSFSGAGLAQTGWFYYVSVTGTVDGVEFTVGDNIVALTDGASTSTFVGNWSKHDQTDAVQAVVGLTGSISKSSLLAALNVQDGATITNAATVEAAGALMDSEVVNLASVKAFDTTDYATAAQGSTADTALQSSDLGAAGALLASNDLSELSSAEYARDNLGLRWLVKSGVYTAVAGEKIAADVSAGAWTLTLPLTPILGAVVMVSVIDGDAATNNLTIDGNGNNIQGDTTLIYDVPLATVWLVYNNTEWRLA
jgi:hypothetical protein